MVEKYKYIKYKSKNIILHISCYIFILLVCIVGLLTVQILFIDFFVFRKGCNYEAHEQGGKVYLINRCNIPKENEMIIWINNINTVNNVMNPYRIYAYWPLSWSVPSFDYDGIEKDLEKIRSDVKTLSNLLIVSAQIADKNDTCFPDMKIRTNYWKVVLFWMYAVSSGPLQYLFPNSYSKFEIWAGFRFQIIALSSIILEDEFSELKKCIIKNKITGSNIF